MYWLSIGFGLAVSWLWLFYLEGPLLITFAGFWNKHPKELFQWFMCANALTFLFLSRGIKLRSVLGKKTALIAGSAILSLCPLLTGILPQTAAAWSHTYPILADLLAVAGGIALALTFTAWMEIFMQSALRPLSLSFGMAIVLASMFTVLGGIADPRRMLPLAVLSPLVSLVMLLSLKHANRSFPAELSPTITRLNPFPLKLVCLIILFYTVGGAMFNIIGREQSFPGMFYLSNAAYALTCMIAAICLYRFPDMDLRLIYRPVLPLFAIGFFLFSFQEKRAAMLAFLLLQGGFALFDMYVWLLIPYFARFCHRPAAVCAFGLFLVTFSLFSGNWLASGLFPLLFGGMPLTYLAFAAGAFSALSVMLFPDDKETFSGWQAVLTPGLQEERPHAEQHPSAAPKANACHSAVLSPLTEREKEVLALLLKGRSVRFISEALNISANTVKFHTRNIYGKLSVSNRQELLTLFEMRKKPET